MTTEPPLSFARNLKAITSSFMRLCNDIMQLAGLEMQLAGKSLLIVIAYICLAFIFTFTAWVFLMVILVWSLLAVGLNWPLASLCIIVLNSLLLALAIFAIGFFAKKVKMQETKKQISEVLNLVDEQNHAK